MPCGARFHWNWVIIPLEYGQNSFVTINQAVACRFIVLAREGVFLVK